MSNASLETHPAPRRYAPALLDLWWFQHFQDALARAQSAVDLEAVRHRIWTSFGRGRSAVRNRCALGRLEEAFLRRREQLQAGRCP